MRVFLITLAASTGASIALWNLGLARLIWPAHPMVLTAIAAAGCAAAVQMILQYDPATRG
jgi:hypothetical protein